MSSQVTDTSSEKMKLKDYSSNIKIEDFTWKDYMVTTGRNYHYIDQAPDSGTDKVGTVLCFHGFPDFAYGFRYLIKELTKRGYRVIVPDQLGCGGTDKPDGKKYLKEYSLRAACDAAIDILKHEGVDKFSVVGHDWGGMIAWRFIQHHSTLNIESFVSICTPPTPASRPGDPAPTWPEVVKNSPTLSYQVWLSSIQAEDKVNANIREFMMLGYWRTWHDVGYPDDGGWTTIGELERVYDHHLKALKRARVPNKEMQEYINVFKKDGLSGPLNWYKTRFINYEEEIQSGLPLEFPPSPPCLWLAAEDDRALPPDMLEDEKLAGLFPGNNITKDLARHGDHWVLQDPRVRDDVVKTVANWVDKYVHHQ